MKVVIDTSSLISLVRYYLPFDKDGKLKNFLEDRILAGQIVVLENVLKECKQQGKGQVIKALPFIANPKYTTTVSDYIIKTSIFNLVDNNFINASVRASYPKNVYQLMRDEFIASGDFAIMLYAYSIKDKEVVTVVSEETGYNNDGKPFKKIPHLCKIIEVPSMTLPTFLMKNSIINMHIDVLKTTIF